MSVITKKIIRKWYLLLGSLLLTLALAYVVILTTPEVYKVSSSMLVRDESATGNQQFMEGIGLFEPQTKISDQTAMLTSFDIIRRTLEKLDFGVTYYKHDQFIQHEIYKRRPFDVELDSLSDQLIGVPIYVRFLSSNRYEISVEADEASVYQMAEEKFAPTKARDVLIQNVQKVGQPVRTPYLNFTLIRNEQEPLDTLSQYSFMIHPLERVTEQYQKKLVVAPFEEGSDILVLTTTGEIVEKELMFLNSLMETYIEDEVKNKNLLGLRTINFIDKQIATVADSLSQVEQSLRSFRDRTRTVDIGTTARDLNTKLDELQKTREDLLIDYRSYQNLFQYLEQNDYTEVIAPSVRNINDEVMSGLLRNLIELNQQRAQLKTSVRQSLPAIEELDAKVKSIRAQLHENVNNLIATTKYKIESVENQIEELDSQINLLPKNEQELINIERKFQFSDNQYNYLLQKRTEVGIAVASNASTKKVVEEARLDGRTPVSPNKILILLTAIVLGLALPVGALILADMFQDKISSREEVANIISMPLVGEVPRLRRKENALVYSRPRSAAAESFRTIRSNLLLQNHVNGASKTLLVTSSVSNEGKTLCSVNLASSFAVANNRTIIIDADLRRPRVHNILEKTNGVGLSNYLQGTADMSEIIQPTDQENLYVITAGKSDGHPGEILLSERLPQLINKLKMEFKFVVLDTPPVKIVTDALVLSAYSDINILVARRGVTSKSQLMDVEELHQNNTLHNLYVVLNDVQATKGHGYYE
ncbi:GumC family protein [Catalinimonas alkaloidigena]|uniref:GumC family protein n=1 Tax=Catalinimonas alkaloidigena TaxID=1075417 RepID=UPI0015A389E2|nr:tyrosine-protein kinase [Catalinimonas alkaloidigena]